jgi:hypothetical protein
VLIHLFSCLAHVVNLAIVDFMSYITKIAAVESSTAIWEYDPSLPGNRVLSGSLDVISAIRTLAVKASIILPSLFDLTNPFTDSIIWTANRILFAAANSIPRSHSTQSPSSWRYTLGNGTWNARLGIPVTPSKYNALGFVLLTISRLSNCLLHRQMNFMGRSRRSAMEAMSRRRYRGQHSISRNLTGHASRIQQKFLLYVSEHSSYLVLTSEKDANRIQQLFSSDKKPTLWRALPAIECLQSAWEAKQKDPKYALYHDALGAGLDKLRKYYKRFDNSPAYVLALGKLSLRSESKLITV